MNCLDCTRLSRSEVSLLAEESSGREPKDHVSAAIGVCAECGAAVCHAHAVIRERHELLQGSYTPITVSPAARILRCTVCDTTYRASQGKAVP